MKKDEINEIDEAIEDYRKAMTENVKSSKAVVDAQIKKQKSHYDLMKASERLRAIQIELMQNI